MCICDVYVFTILDQANKKGHHVHVCTSNQNRKLQHYMFVVDFFYNNDDNKN